MFGVDIHVVFHSSMQGYTGPVKFVKYFWRWLYFWICTTRRYVIWNDRFCTSIIVYTYSHIFSHILFSIFVATHPFSAFAAPLFSTVIIGGQHHCGRLGNSSISTVPPAYSCLRCDGQSVLKNVPGYWGVAHQWTLFLSQFGGRTPAKLKNHKSQDQNSLAHPPPPTCHILEKWIQWVISYPNSL